MRADILASADGVRAFPVFTTQKAAREYYADQLVLSAMPITLKQVLEIMGNKGHNATEIIVNFQSDTSLHLDEREISRIKILLKTIAEETNDGEAIDK